MTKKITIAFLILVLIQALHSIEEYMGKLWEVFPPARFFCSLISNDLENGFLIANISLFVIGIVVWLIPVRKNYPVAKSFIWFWIVIEMINGIGHPAWALYEWSYTPGVITAPFLLILAIYLAREMSKNNLQTEMK